MPAANRDPRASHTLTCEAFRRYDPALPPLAPGGRLQLHWHARETAVRIREDTVVAAWTFEGDVPGPVVQCRVGDTVEFTLTNDAEIPHSMDFHAAQIDPKVAFRSVQKGQSVTFTFRPKWAGAFMYHCGTADESPCDVIEASALDSGQAASNARCTDYGARTITKRADISHRAPT